MYRRFRHFIAQEHLLTPGQQVLLAVSGGRDSVTLCHLLARYMAEENGGEAKQRFAIAHCNFHLRPGDCDRDEQFVRSLAESYGVPCYVKQCDTQAYAAQHHLSIEEAARHLRYAFFEEVMVEHGYEVLATAHHRDDATETFFINLMRGTGIAGLHGIKVRSPFAEGRPLDAPLWLVRPLLCFGRADIDNYVKCERLEYVEDYTNAEPTYLRNRIRLQLMPLLRDMEPAIDTVMSDNLARFAEAELLYNEAVDTHRKLLKPEEGEYSIDIAALRATVAPATVLFELLRPYGFTATLCRQILDALDGQPGKQFLSPTHRLIKDRSQLYVYPLRQEDDEYMIADTYDMEALPIPLRLTVETPQMPCPALPPNEALFDMEKVKYPLTLRHWREGDRFQPFGMHGSRKLSDYFKDIKLNLEQKRQVWLLCDADGHVLWLVGLRASGIAAVTSTTSEVLHARL
ncbi:MAG: tRNA lysidine(34) synthetase TilS [Bacteroidales bacterium]|nr:tRNA lysidine(34) synthetase TilS [Bacteroidales bacterium]